MIAKTPPPPYYAVIFTSLRKEGDHGYNKMALQMHELASTQEGFLGVESARDSIGITISYWKSLEAIQNWRTNADHIMAKRMGQQKWYREYMTRISKVEQAYGMMQKSSDY